MLDLHWLRADPEFVRQALARRGFDFDSATFRELETERRRLQLETEQLQSERNSRSKKIGHAKAAGEEVQPLLDEVASLAEKVRANESALEEIRQKLDEFLQGIPNILHESVPDGHSEEDNTEVCRWGEPGTFGFKARDHVELGETLGLLDFESATRVAGSRFVVMRAELAGLHRALIQFMLDTHTHEHGYTEVNVPYLVNPGSLFGTGQLPKFADDQFHIAKQDLYLIPTAEVPVTNLARDRIIPADQLPQKYVCHTPCFRSEAGSYGQDTRGMIRQHQFEKVELVQLVRPVDSYRTLEELTAHAESILQKLKLPYRKVILCSGDTGFSAAKTYDLEVWLPGQGKYREISSCSNFEAFQARRMKARWRNPDTGKPELIHTLNGSGLAAGRTLIAIMENYQTKAGSISIPEVLQPYLRGRQVIG